MQNHFKMAKFALVTCFLVATILLPAPVSCSNILLLPAFTKANQIFYESMETELQLAGHEVTVLLFRENLGSRIPPPDAIIIENGGIRFPDGADAQLQNWELAALNEWSVKVAAIPNSYAAAFERQCEDILDNAEIIQQLSTKVRPHLILADMRFGACGLALGQMLNTPVAGVLASPFPYQTSAPHSPFHVPIMMDRNTQKDESYWERLFVSYEYLKNIYYSENEVSAAICKRVPECKSVVDLYQNLSLIFVNSFFMWDVPIRPVYPKLVFVGGLNFHTAALLPKDLEAIARSYKAGIILVTLVTAVSNDKYPEYVHRSIFQGLSRLPHATFWKTNLTEVKNLPDNFFINEQFSSQNIMGHVRTRIVISFCDRDTVFAAIYQRVPILCIPMLEDQVDLARRVEAQGIGLTLNLSQLSPDSLIDYVHTIITTKSFRDNVHHHSEMLRDQPQMASSRLIFWTEYAIRHRGAKHLRNPALQLTFSVQDVLIYTVFIVLASIYFIAVYLVFTKPKQTRAKKTYVKTKHE